MLSSPSQRFDAELAALRPTRAIHIGERRLGRIGLRTEGLS
jgi:hypothetical protein